MLASRIAQIIPASATFCFARFSGDCAYWFYPSRRRVALENLTIAFGDSKTDREKKKIARLSFQNMAFSAVELFLIPKTVREASSHFQMINGEALNNAFAQGKGVILVISHLGSWEYLSFLPFLTGKRWSVVVRNIKNPFLDREVNDLRKMTTVNPISKDASMRGLIRELKANNGVAILIDQWAGNEGVWQHFFGKPTSTTSVPARLSQRFGSPLVPAYCLRNAPGFYTIEIHDPVATQGMSEDQITEKLNSLFEAQIRKYPEQWLWMHRRWKAKPAFDLSSKEEMV